MPIRRKLGLRTGARIGAPSHTTRAELMKANLKRFHELIQSNTAAAPGAKPNTPVAAAPAPPAAPRAAAPEPPRAPMGEVISPRRGQGGVSSVRMAQAGRQVRSSVHDMREMLRGSSLQLLRQESMEEIVDKANQIADMAATGVQLTGEITQFATAAELYRAQKSGPIPPRSVSAADAGADTSPTPRSSTF